MPNVLLYPTAADHFLSWGESTNRLSPATRRLYGTLLRVLQDRYPGRPVSEVMTVSAILGYFAVDATGRPRSVGEKGWTENTVDSHLRAYRSFSRFGVNHGYCEDLRASLADAYTLRVRTRRRAQWLTQEQVRLISKRCPQTPLGQRDRHVVLVAALTGLRRSELAAARWDHVDLVARTLYVPQGKGGKPRDIGLVPRAAELLSEWKTTAIADIGVVPGPVYLFPRVHAGRRRWVAAGSQLRTPLCGETLVRAVRSAGERAGLRALAPHDLRRTFAAILEDAGVPVQTISAQLGHASLDVTVRYLDSNPRRRADELARVAVTF